MIEVEIKGVALSLETAAGLFSPRQADRGTLAMLSCVDFAPGAKVLDLGCGTGLELEYYFRLNSTAMVTGIDLAAGMLQKLKEKFL